MSLRPGDAVEHFVIVSLLGEGGMGQVYLARDTRLARSVALKIVQPDVGDGADGSAASNGAARLLREAQAAAGLEHPNVVTIYEVGEIRGQGEEAGRPFIAMELVKGRPLSALVGDAGVAMKERIRWLVDTARALGAAHKAGLVHRDIKPDNVMVREDGVVKVLDFGLAKRSRGESPGLSSSTEAQVLPSLTGKGVAIGTPYYMAPEQMRREPLDGRADQFSWGVVAYELLSGVPAWGSDVDALELVSKLLSEDPAPLEDVCPDVPAHVAAAVKRAMSKRRAARFETMEELIAALGDETGALKVTLPSAIAKALSAAASTEGPPVAPRPGAPPSRRRLVPGLRALGLGAAVLALASTAAVVGLRRRAAHEASAAMSASAAPAAGCTSHVECAREHGGEPYVCRASDHQCVAVASEDCTPLYEPRDLTHEDTVWLGTLFPLHGPAAEAYGQMHANGAELARKEIANGTSALDGEGSSQRVRRIALVSCDDSADGLRAAHHLVDDIGVPAILGFKNGQEVVDIAGGYLIKKGVMTVASITSSPLITKLPQPEGQRLVWRTYFSMEGVAKAVAAMVERFFEPRLRTSTTPMRILLVRYDTPSNRTLAETLFRTLQFNGKSAVNNGKDYDEITLRSDELASHDASRFVERAVRDRPSLIICGLEDKDADFAEAAEKALGRLGAAPVWLSPNGSTTVFDGFIGASSERRHRTFSVLSTSESEANARFVIRYNETGHAPVSRGVNPFATYDGAYLLAYAVFAQQLGPVTGERLAAAVPRLEVPGLAVDVGPSDLLQGVSAVASGRPVDLRGAGGSLDFDVATGEALVDFALRCPDVDTGGRAQGEVESGVVFRGAAGKIEGVARCP